MRGKTVKPQLEVLEDRLALDSKSASIFGVDARNLTPGSGAYVLSGAGVQIGQVELGRPGMPAFDSPAQSHPDVAPVSVFLRGDPAAANTDVLTAGGHAEAVAGVMVSTTAIHRGVAPGASLHASAYRTGGGFGYTDAMLSMQQVASQTGMRAINMSWYKETEPMAQLDGTSLVSKGLDWSAQAHNVLYVLSRGNAADGGMIPKDSYNGVTVAASAAVETGTDQVFRWVSPVINNFTNASDGRRLTHLVAPGVEILGPLPGVMAYRADTGSSYAAPHVTGAVALLQEYANYKMSLEPGSPAPGWGADS